MHTFFAFHEQLSSFRLRRARAAAGSLVLINGRVNSNMTAAARKNGVEATEPPVPASAASATAGNLNMGSV